MRGFLAAASALILIHGSPAIAADHSKISANTAVVHVDKTRIDRALDLRKHSVERRRQAADFGAWITFWHTTIQLSGGDRCSVAAYREGRA